MIPYEQLCRALAEYNAAKNPAEPTAEDMASQPTQIVRNHGEHTQEVEADDVDVLEATDDDEPN